MDKSWSAHEQVGVHFKQSSGLVTFCKYLREQRQEYELAGDNTVILPGSQLDQILAQRLGWLKDLKPDVNAVVSFSDLPKDAQVRAVRHRLLLDTPDKRS